MTRFGPEFIGLGGSLASSGRVRGPSPRTTNRTLPGSTSTVARRTQAVRRLRLQIPADDEVGGPHPGLGAARVDRARHAPARYSREWILKPYQASRAETCKPLRLV